MIGGVIIKRYDAAKDPAATDYIPVARAAALLHDRLFPGHSVKDAKSLDMLALALSTVVPMYLRDPDTGVLRALDKAVIARGRFTRGATRLEFGEGAPLRFLLVSRRELYPAMDALAADPSSPILRMCSPPQPAGDAARAA
jgi:hypothetical protein